MNAWPLQSECDAFYGNPRGGGTYSPAWAAANLTHVHCPWQLHMGKLAIPYITIHKKCADSLTRVLAAVWDACGHDQAKIDAIHASEFDGSFNYRPKRGASSLSMHAYGCAIDWDAEHNGMGSHTHFFTKDNPLIKAFKDEGWIWGGDWSSPDAMHQQAARVHA